MMNDDDDVDTNDDDDDDYDNNDNDNDDDDGNDIDDHNHDIDSFPWKTQTRGLIPCWKDWTPPTLAGGLHICIQFAHLKHSHQRLLD